MSKKQITEINIRPDSFHGEWNYTIRPNNGRNLIHLFHDAPLELDRSKGRLNHKIGGNWWVEARIFGVFLTGPLLADQKYFADGEAFFGKDA